jgi:hypothetical protein
MKVAVYQVDRNPIMGFEELLFEYELDGLKPIPSIGEYVNCGVHTKQHTMKVVSKEFLMMEDTIKICLEI